MWDAKSLTMHLCEWNLFGVMVAAVVKGDAERYAVFKIVEQRNAVHSAAHDDYAVFHSYFAAMHSTSTRAPFGRSFTANAERAGNGSFEELGVYFVHLAEILDVGKHYRCLDNVAEVETSRAEDFASVVQSLTGLLLDATLNEFTCCWVERNLTGSEYETVYFNCLAVRPMAAGALSVFNAFINLKF